MLTEDECRATIMIDFTFLPLVPTGENIAGAYPLRVT